MANVHGQATEDSPSPWTPTITSDTQKKAPGSWPLTDLALAAVAILGSELVIEVSITFSVSVSLLLSLKICFSDKKKKKPSLKKCMA